MKTSCKILLVVVLLGLVGAVALECHAAERIRRIRQGIFLYSNWDGPFLVLDTCLDMTINHAVVPDTVTWYGRKYPVVEIGPGAFRGCRNLTVLEVGTHIGNFLKGALLDCPNLRVINVNRERPPEIVSRHPFYGCTWQEVIEPYHTLSTIIVVPEGCEQAYREAPGWKEFKVIQSHMPDGSELMIDEIDVRINEIESELRRLEQQARRLREELDALRRTREPAAGE